ncbi:hypothetical protein NQ315_017440 [Exocentrus adspersus]|uniref:Tyr recombinase domain-containing protein n=1 Tax=Exocentrus adspersus TaxID=1586481 RepID=A0AAV8VKN8_9CUCU|nr:hypothetical protein NQ315_017440 [Exocentrus adspersus]
MSDTESDVPSDIVEAAQRALSTLIPTKSKLRLDAAYTKFTTWCEDKKRFPLHAFVKKNFSPSLYLEPFLRYGRQPFLFAHPVALIIGIAGACRKSELTFLRVENVTDQGQYMKVTIPNTKTKIFREFAITSEGIEGLNFIEIVRKYISVRPPTLKNDRFFVKYSDGKCGLQPVGINTFGNLPKKIAHFLKLPNAGLYTSHCFRIRRSSTTLLADSGADILKIKQHGGWKSNTVAEGYIENSIENKQRIASRSLGETSSMENTQINATAKTSLSVGMLMLNKG